MSDQVNDSRGAAVNEMIVATDLVKTYPPGVRALDAMTLRVPEGTIFGLLGPNGAGKSTTVRVLTTLSRPDSGAAWVAGIDVLAEPVRARHAIGVVGQKHGADLEATGRENLVIQGEFYGLTGRGLRERVEQSLEHFGLADAADRRVKTYSGGMQRRLDVALGLIHRPRILFLDEPTTGLDPEVRAQMWGEIERLARDEGLTVLLTTHYLEEAEARGAGRDRRPGPGCGGGHARGAEERAERRRDPPRAAGAEPRRSTRRPRSCARRARGPAWRCGPQHPRPRRGGGPAEGAGRARAARGQRHLPDACAPVPRRRVPAARRQAARRGGGGMTAVRQTRQVSLRYLRALLRQPAWVGITLTQPLIWLLLFGALFKAVTRIPGFHGGSYIQYLAPGIVVMLAVSSAGWTGMGFIEDMTSGVMDRTLASPVWRGALNLGSVAQAVLTIAIQSTLIVLLGLVLGAHYGGGVGGVAILILVACLLGGAFASLSNGVALHARQRETLIGAVSFVLLPLTFLSSALMERSLVPHWIRTISAYNPVNWAADAGRSAAIGHTDWGLVASRLGLLALLLAVCAWFATAAFTAYQRSL
jgi:ABC-2 type transport system permease protein